MYQKPYTCTEINVLLHSSDLRALILRYNNVREPTFPEIQKHFNLIERSQSWHAILLSLSNSLYLYARPQREILSGGMMTDIGPFCQGQGQKSGKDQKKYTSLIFGLQTELLLIY